METLGERLAAERRKAGKSVVDIESGTHIRAGLIEALESGDYDRLPSPAYVRGYIQSYAKVLEIPAEPLLRMYEEETGGRHAPSPVGELPADQVVPRREHANALPMRTAVGIAGVVVAVVLAIWGISSALSGPEEPPPVPPTSDVTEPATTTPRPENDEPSEPAAETTEAPAAPPPFTLVVEIAEGGASWLVVDIDGEQVHVGTLRDGERKEWEVAERAVISQIGKPSEVTLTRDGEPVEIPDSAEPPTVTLEAEETD